MKTKIHVVVLLSNNQGHILLVDNYLILSLKSTRELSNCRPLEFVPNEANIGRIFLVDNYLILSLISMRELSNCRPKNMSIVRLLGHVIKHRN